jgi:hypothetical protein
MALEQLKFFTQSSEWIRADRQPRTVPFEQIVGMALGNTVLWEDSRRQPKELHYNPADTAVRELCVDGEFARRVMSYFGRYRVNPIGSKDPYNCHSFAAWMRDDLRLTSDNQLPGGAQPISDEYAYTRPAPGSHIVARNHERDATSDGVPLAHSVIDLGGEFLAVMGMDGPLALDTLDATFGHYNERYGETSWYVSPAWDEVLARS